MNAITFPAIVRRHALRSRVSLLRALFTGRGDAGWVEPPPALRTPPGPRAERMMRSARKGAL
jgi:hypothetical protein